MEFIMALGVPEGAPLLAASALVHLASTSAIGIRLVTVGTVVAETTIMGAALPADGTNTDEARLAIRVAQGAILLLVISASRERLSGCAAVGFLPA